MVSQLVSAVILVVIPGDSARFSVGLDRLHVLGFDVRNTSKVFALSLVFEPQTAKVSDRVNIKAMGHRFSFAVAIGIIPEHDFPLFNILVSRGLYLGRIQCSKNLVGWDSMIRGMVIVGVLDHIGTV